MESNLFEALRIKENEVVMCRFLADLLDPKGWHGLGTQFLKSFLEKVIQLEGLECLERTCVMTEYLIDNGRRIDIILQNPGFSLPIEAKINARDQQGQCYDYLPYARKAPLVYLTKHGGKPSEWSRKTAGEKEGEIRCVSWESICDWLEQEPEVLEQVRQYTEAIRSFLPKSTKTSVDCGLIRDVLAAFRSGMGQGIAERYGLEGMEVLQTERLSFPEFFGIITNTPFPVFAKTQAYGGDLCEQEADASAGAPAPAVFSLPCAVCRGDTVF